MIYNMLTITMQLTVIGFAVAVIGYYGFKKSRSRLFLVELFLAFLGSFLGTLLEVLVRQLFNLPLLYYVLFQFLFPLITSILVVTIYRLANSVRE